MRLEVDVEKRLGAFALRAAFSAEGATTALFGRSGSGKSTLLNLIAGLHRPQRGRIAIGDAVLFDSGRGIDMPAHQRRIGYVFQEGRLLPHLSVRQNLMYGRFFTPPAERYTDFDRVVALLDLGQLLARRPHALSGGEKQRVAIGRALVKHPAFCFADEPTSALDWSHGRHIVELLRSAAHDRKASILVVSHDPRILPYADQVLHLVDGCLAETTAPKQKMTECTLS